MSKRECIVVTGASRGIGAAIAFALAQQGHHVACLSRSGSVPAMPSVTPDVSAKWIPVKADVTDRQALDLAFKHLEDEGWAVKGMVNNAGVHLDGPSAEISLDHWHQVMNTNATSVLLACQAAYPSLVAAGGGMIVNIGSFFEKLGVKHNLAYCASKAAVGAITRCLAVEWASKGIRVVDVAPGYIETDLNAEAMAPGSPLRSYLSKRIPGREPGKASEVAEFVSTLFTAAGVFLTGETIFIDGGQGVAH